MALLLNDVVICGVIDNRTRNKVHGWIQLRGRDRPLVMNLTGNCGEDLVGRCIYFQSSNPSAVSDSDIDLARLAPRQVGPVGVMTANGRIQIAHCSAEDMLLCGEFDESRPLEWKQSLFLEWFGQNGHIIVELLGASVQSADTDLVAPPEVLDAEESLAEDDGFSGDSDEEDDPFHLFPHDLETHLVLGITFEEAETDPLSDEELEELAVDFGEETPLNLLFDPPLRLNPSCQLNDDQLAESLQVLLARLARHGVALDMCEHYTPRQAYRLLLEQILPEETIPATPSELGYVHRYATHEFCSSCLDDVIVEDARDDVPSDD